MHTTIDLFELPSWRIISIGRCRRKGEELRSLIGSVEDVFSNWFNSFSAMHANTNGFSLSHGAIWESSSTRKPYVKTFQLFTLAHQKIIKFNEICKVLSHDCFLEDMDISLKYLSGGLYARVKAKEYSEIPDAVSEFLSKTLRKSIFTWNGKPCVEIYREPYPKITSDDAIQIFFPITLPDSCIGDIIHCCSYCGKYYRLDEVADFRECCKRFSSKIKFDAFGEVVFQGANEDA